VSSAYPSFVGRIPKPKVASSSLVARLMRSPANAGLVMFRGRRGWTLRVGLNRSQTVREAVRGDLVMIQSVMGHSTLATTGRYLHARPA
jgi:hypothetical protein